MDIMTGGPGNSPNLNYPMARSCDLTPGKTRDRSLCNIIFPGYIREINTTRPSDLKAWRGFIGLFSAIHGQIQLSSCLAVSSSLNCNSLLLPIIYGPTRVDLIPAGDRVSRFQR